MVAGTSENCVQVYDNDGEKFRQLSGAAHVPSAACAQNGRRRARYDRALTPNVLLSSHISYFVYFSITSG